MKAKWILAATSAVVLALAVGAKMLHAKADPVPDVLPAKITYLDSRGTEAEVSGDLVFDTWPIVLLNGKKLNLKRAELVSLRNKRNDRYKCWMKREEGGKFVVCTRLKICIADFGFDRIPLVEGGGAGSSPVSLRVKEKPSASYLDVKRITRIDIQIVRWQDY